MNAPVRLESPAAPFGEILDSMPTDFDRLIQGSVNQLIFSDARMDRMMKMAEILAKGKVTVPQHLQNNVGDCMAIVLQAAQWNMDPFAVAQKTHLVSIQPVLIAARPCHLTRNRETRVPLIANAFAQWPS